MQLRTSGWCCVPEDRRCAQLPIPKVDQRYLQGLGARQVSHAVSRKASHASLSMDLASPGSRSESVGGSSQICESQSRAWDVSSGFSFPEATAVLVQLSRASNLESSLLGKKITPRSLERGVHGQLVGQLLSVLSGNLAQLDVELLVATTQALAAVKHRPPEHWGCELLDALELHMGGLSPSQVASCMTSFSKLHIRPQKPWLEHAMRQVLLPNGPTTMLDVPFPNARTPGTKGQKPSTHPAQQDVAGAQFTASVHACGLNAQDHVKLMSALASMSLAPSQPVLSSLEILSAPLLSQMPLPVLASLSEAYTKLGHRLGKAWLDALMAAAAPLINTAQPKELALFVAAVSELKGGDAVDCLGSDLMNIVWSRTASLMVDESMLLGSFIELVSAAAKLHATRKVSAPNEWLHLCVAHAGRLVPAMQPYHLCSLLHSFARMRLTSLPTDVQSALAVRLLTLMPKLNPSHLSKVSAAFSRLQLRHLQPGLANAYSSQVCSFDLTSLRPDVLSNLLHGMATAKSHVDVKQQITLLGATYAVMRHANPHDLCCSIASLARMGVRPDAAWSERILLEVRRRLPKCSAANLACLCWGLSTMGINPATQWIDMVAAEAAGKMCCCSPKHLSQLLWAFSNWGYCPTHSWMEHYYTVALAQLRTSDAHSQAVIMTAVANMPSGCLLPPPAWLEALSNAFLQRAHMCSPQSLTNTMRAFARLSYCPGQAWMARTADLLHELSLSANGTNATKPNLHDLAHAVWALDKMGFQAPPTWLECHAQLTLQAARVQITSVHQRLLLEQSQGHPEQQRRDPAVEQQADQPSGRQDQAGAASPGTEAHGLGGTVSETAVADMAAAAVRHAASSAVSRHVASSLLSLSNLGYEVCMHEPRHPTSHPEMSPLGEAADQPRRPAVSEHAQLAHMNGHRLSRPTYSSTFAAVEAEPLDSFTPLLTLGLSLVPVATPQSLASLALMLGRRRVALGQQAMRLFVGTCWNRMPAMSGQELLLLAWGLARMSAPPDQEWLDRFQFTVFQRCQGVQASGREGSGDAGLSITQRIALLRLAAAAKSALHPRLLASLLPSTDLLMELSSLKHAHQEQAAPQAGRPPLSAAHLATVAWSLARLHVLPGEVWAMAFLTACATSIATERISVGSLAKLSWSLASLWVLPPIDWTLALLERAGQMAPEMGARNLSDTLWACARFLRPGGARGHTRKRLIRPHLARTKPALALLAARAEALLCSGQLQGRSLLITLWALARLQVPVSPAFRSAARQAAVRALPHAPPQLLLVSVWALDRLEVQPTRTFLEWLRNLVDGHLIAVGGSSLMHMYFAIMRKMEYKCKQREALLTDGDQDTRCRMNAALAGTAGGKEPCPPPILKPIRRPLRTLHPSWSRVTRRPLA